MNIVYFSCAATHGANEGYVEYVYIRRGAVQFAAQSLCIIKYRAEPRAYDSPGLARLARCQFLGRSPRTNWDLKVNSRLHQIIDSPEDRLRTRPGSVLN